ncbi:MAG: peptidoglycan DD-metalloendopeptidase family protein [Phycisphaerae bacterium]|nr:peptidoglycan DD-metalloendopeptidase family protein [Gemmatimonadaceae bacterium]
MPRAPKVQVSRVHAWRLLCFAFLAASAFAATPAVKAQTVGSSAAATEARLRQQQQELDKVRRERSALEARLTELQRSARTIAEEVANLERQADATSRLVQGLDVQLTAINQEVDSATGGLINAEDELAGKRAVLQRRVIDIYKRGQLHDAEALLSAQSFGALVARYKYLHELARRDRALVNRVETLRNQISQQRQLLVRLQDEVQRNRAEKAQEEVRLRALEGRRQRNLTGVLQTTVQTRDRLSQLAKDEARVTNVIAGLEATRRRAEAVPNAAPVAPSTIRTTDLGKLDWPVDGNILYRFGRVINPNNTTIRWNGLGIGAAAGTTVRSISSGEVVLADLNGTYGLTVILQHGGGDYSVYSSLARLDVRKGQQVVKGQSLGTVGATDPELPPHLHFEIRPRGRAVDPLEWLRKQRP